jgi:hypothetical protein
MDDDIIDKLTAEEAEKVNFDPQYTKRFSSTYMKSLNSYDIKKAYFELFVFKVLRPTTQYMYIESDTCMVKEKFSYDTNGIKNAFLHIGDGTINNFGNEGRFITRWLNDPDLKCYNYMDFVPYNGLVDPNPDEERFNVFDGYDPRINTPYNKEDQAKLIKPFLDLCKEICEGNEQFSEQLIKYFAHLIQKPGEKIPKYWAIVGLQGTGKNTLLDAIANVIGRKYYITSSNPNDFFSEHAEGFCYKLLVNMNELEKMQIKQSTR